VANPAHQKCPECGAKVRADRLPRHLHRVHKRIGADGKISIYDLVRILGVKGASAHLARLAELGEQRRSHSKVINGGPPVEVLDNLGPRADRRGDMNMPSNPDQTSQSLEVLRAKVAELEAKLSKRDQSPPVLPVSSAGLPVERFSFKLLPPGTWGMEDVIAYYRREAHRFPADIHDRGIDWTRFESIKSLRPAKCYVGQEQWLGYVAFEFLGSSRVVLECPVTGNATYVLWDDWKRMVTHPKRYIWRHFPQSYRKIVHKEKSKWLARTRRALKLR
jgi:hypothetical protein